MERNISTPVARVRLRVRQPQLDMPDQKNRPLLAIPLILILLGAPLILLPILDDYGFPATIQGWFLASLIPMLIIPAIPIGAQAVRIRRNQTCIAVTSKLTFTSSTYAPWAFICSFLFGFIAGALGIAHVISTWREDNSFFFLKIILPTCLLLFGAFGLYGQIQLIHFPRSLALDPTGISGRAQGRQTRSGRGTPFSLTWDELREVVVGPRRTGAPERLMLRGRDDEMITFVREDVGGDIREIAEVVEFFRVSPPAQRQLADPVTALDLAATTSPPLQRSWQ